MHSGFTSTWTFYKIFSKSYMAKYVTIMAQAYLKATVPPVAQLPMSGITIMA